MSHTMQILDLLAGGQTYTAKQLAAELGLTQQQVFNAMGCLRRHKAIRAVDQPYAVTAAGESWRAERQGRLDLAASRAAMKERNRFRPRKVVVAEPNPRTQAMVEGAMKNQPALQSVWGAHA